MNEMNVSLLTKLRNLQVRNISFEYNNKLEFQNFVFVTNRSMWVNKLRRTGDQAK